MGNAAAFAALDAHIEHLRTLGTSFVRDAAPDVAVACREELEQQIAKGVGPDGQAWEPRKEDGGQPLENAAKYLVVVAVGTAIFMRLKGHVARHHRGIARGGLERLILPTKGITRPIGNAIKRVLAERFQQTMGAR
jgi:hypothetical protein